MKILMVTSEWPDEFNPHAAPFVRSQFNKLRENNIDVDLIHLRGSMNIRNYIKKFFLIKRIINNGNYDILHAQWGQAALPLIFFSIPLVITYRGDDVEGMIGENGKKGVLSLLLRLIGKFVSLFASHIIVVSEHMIKKLGTPKSYSVIPSGINFNNIPNLTKAQAREELNISNEKTVFLFPNSVKVKRKNFELAKSAFDLLPEKLMEKCELRVVHGIEHKEMLKYMIASDFLLFTSIHEGSPNVVKESLACNLPIISVDVADVKIRIGKIPGCFVCKSYDCKELSNLLKLGLEFNYDKYYSRNSVLELDENTLILKLIGIYESLIIN